MDETDHEVSRGKSHAESSQDNCQWSFFGTLDKTPTFGQQCADEEDIP